MGLIKWYKNKRWFFRFYIPTRVIEETYLAIPREEWAILESVEGFCALTWLLINVDKKATNKHKKIQTAVKVVRVAFVMAECKQSKKPLTKEDIEDICHYILFALFNGNS